MTPRPINWNFPKAPTSAPKLSFDCYTLGLQQRQALNKEPNLRQNRDKAMPPLKLGTARIGRLLHVVNRLRNDEKHDIKKLPMDMCHFAVQAKSVAVDTELSAPIFRVRTSSTTSTQSSHRRAVPESKGSINSASLSRQCMSGDFQWSTDNADFWYRRNVYRTF